MRTKVTNLDIESPGESAGKAFITDGSGEVIISGVPFLGHHHVESQITDIVHDAVKLRTRNISTTAPADGQTYRWDSGASEWIPSGVIATDEKVGEVQQEGVQKATAVSILNFKGTAVNDITDDGGGKVSIDLTASGSGATEFTGLSDTPSSYTGDGGKAVIVKGTEDGLEFGEAVGGSDLEVKDEGTVLTSSGTSLDFVGNVITATVDGTKVTVTVSGAVIAIPDFEGTRVYRTTDIPSPAFNTWTAIEWGSGDGAESYDTEGWFPGTADDNIQVTKDGYYRIYGQISWNKSSTAGFLQAGIWLNGTSLLISEHIRGFSNDYDTPVTTAAATLYFLTTNDSITLKYFISENNTFPIASGVGKTYLEVHEIQPVVQNRLSRVYRSSNQTISNTTDTAVSFNTEQYDTDDFWTSGQATRITIPVDGYYHITSMIAWEQNNTGYRRHWLRLNGSTAIAESRVEPSDLSDSGSLVETAYYFNVGDYVEVYVWHNKGSSSNVLGSISRLYISTVQIGT